MKTTIARNALLGAAVAGLFGSATAQAGEKSPESYVMTVYSDTRHGSAVLEGSPDDVISKLMRDHKGNPKYLADLITLCVAYTQTKQIDRAVEACDYAITAAEKEARRLERSGPFSSYYTRKADTGRAIALTNRGVLHAVSGQSDQARVMFEQALGLRSREESAAINLSLLDERLAGSGS
jgi:hypothetical protein